MSDENKEGFIPEEEKGIVGENPKAEENVTKEDVEKEVIEKEVKGESISQKWMAEAIEAIPKVETPEEFPLQTNELSENAKKEEKKKKTLGWSIASAVLVIILVIAGMRNQGAVLEKPAVDMPVTYTKGNQIFMDDLKNPKFQVSEKFSDGGQMQQYYAAWGATPSEDGKVIYYPTAVKKDGTFDLYKRVVDAKAEEGIKVVEGINDYQISKDGSGFAYIKKGELFLHDGNKDVAIAKGVGPSQTNEDGQSGYFLSQKGDFVAYGKSVENGAKELYVSTSRTAEPIKLSGSLVQYMMAEAENCLYYVTQDGKDEYSIYAYESGKTPVLITQQATGIELLPTGTGLYYTVKSSGVTKWSDVVIDDKVEEDKLVETPDLKNPTKDKAYEKKLAAYNEKVARDEIRLAIKDAEIPNVMQDAYIWQKGKKTGIAKGMLNGKLVDAKAKYLLYSQIGTSNMVKINLTQVHSMEELQYAYFANLTTQPRQTFLVKKGKKPVVLERANVDSASFIISDAEDRIAFMEIDGQTGAKKLVRAKLAKDGSVSDYLTVAENVDTARFMGKTNELVFYTMNEDANGTLSILKDDTMTALSETADVYYVSEDTSSVFYISDITDVNTGSGTLYQYVEKDGVGTTMKVDEEVFTMQNKGNGAAIYLKKYDLEKGIGELHYLKDGKSRKVDENVSAIFIY